MNFLPELLVTMNSKGVLNFCGGDNLIENEHRSLHEGHKRLEELVCSRPSPVCYKWKPGATNTMAQYNLAFQWVEQF